jgi:hypothetical protein
MKAFVSDCCVVKSDAFAPVDILWKAHCIWARENDSRPYSKRKFIVEIKGACPAIKRERKRIELSHLKEVYNWDTGLENNRMSVLCGIDLNRECKNKWDSGTSGTGEVAK